MDFFQAENFWLYLPLIIWTSGIFYLSSNKGSTANTSRWLDPLFDLIFPHSAEEKLNIYHLVFRKLCHFIGYGILALFASIVFYNSSANVLAKYWLLFAFGVTFLVAATDEIKQSFYADRQGSVTDVVLDCFGGLTMILVFRTFVNN